MITVVVVDDHAVVRSGLRLLLDANEDIEVVGEAGNAKDAIFRARALKPDVMLLDVVMPGSSGIDALPELLKESPETKVLVLSMQDDPSYVREAFGAGASGYVLKEAADEEVVSAVREIANGGDMFTPALVPAWSPRKPRRERRLRLIHYPSGSARCCDCSRLGIRIRRLRKRSTFLYARRNRTVLTSCRSFGSRPSGTRALRIVERSSRRRVRLEIEPEPDAEPPFVA